MRRWSLRILIGAAAFVLLTSVLCLALEDALIYHPSRVGPYDVDPGFPREFHTITTSDGLKLHGCYSPTDGARGTILWLHGNGGNLSICMDGMADLKKLGASVFIFDYRGYGRSEGSPTEEGLYRDAEAAYHFLTGPLKTPPERVVIFGKSLGGAPAIRLASRVPCAGVIIQSAFTSVPDMAPERMPLFPWVWPLVRTQFPSLQTIPSVTPPKLFIHSRDDESIPFWMGQKLFEAAREPKEFFAVTGFGHSDRDLRKSDSYQHMVRAFLDRRLPK